jgi:hypothetical protein
MATRLERVSAQEGHKTGKGFGSGKSEDRKGLRLRKIGRLERASAQEDRKIGRDFGSGRLEDQKGLRLRKVGRSKRASAQEDRKGWKELRLLKTAGPESASWKDREAERA